MSWSEQQVTTWMLEAAEIALDYFKRAQVEVKSDRSLVTEADLAVDRYFDAKINQETDGLLICEESIGDKDADYCERAMQNKAYILDPIDGTINYASGLELWGISLAYMEAGELKEGAIYMPLLGQLLITHGDQVLSRSIRNGKVESEQVLSPSPLLDTDKSLIAVTQNMSKYSEIKCSNPIHSLGVAVYPLVYFIKGHYAAYLANLKLWDMAGAMPMLERLGYETTLWSGEKVGTLVNSDLYQLDPNHPRRWGLKDYLVFCRPGMRESLVNSIELKKRVDEKGC